jgi:plastocyanin
MKRNRATLILRRALSFEVGASALIVVIILAAAFSLAYRPFASNVSQATVSSSQSGVGSAQLPVMNQTPTTREIWVQWEETQSGQDRFYPNFIVVNQGDTVKLTFINNDTVIHNFVIGAPYDINVNASVPGLNNDLTGAKVTVPATNNSPGVVVTGRPGSVTARYTFVAQYAGIYEFVCTYHVTVGMFGYLVVLPNAAYQPSSTATLTTPTSPAIAQVTILNGAAYPNSTGYSPSTITVVIGVNNTVQWVNNDTAPHTVTATDHSFDSGNLNPSDTWSYTFTKPGSYTYVCTYHPWMKGTVVVLSA